MNLSVLFSKLRNGPEEQLEYLKNIQNYYMNSNMANGVIDIEQKSNDIKMQIAQFETTSFVTQICYFLSTGTRSGFNTTNLKSPLRQLSYLIALFLNTPEPSKGKTFDLVSGNMNEIEEKLDEIEKGYNYNPLTGVSANKLTEEYIQKVGVANSTYLNYFLNGPLNYTEQEIDKIEKTFGIYEDYIFKNTGLYIQDFIDFFEVTERIEMYKYEKLHSDLSKYVQIHNITSDFQNIGNNFGEMFDLVENGIRNLQIHKTDLEIFIEPEKVNKFLSIFSIKRGVELDPNYLYYTQECPLLRRPIISLSNDWMIIVCQKQIIHSTYEYLFDICKLLDKQGNKISERKSKILEEKTVDVFMGFSEAMAKVFTNYYINGGKNEKDILLLIGKTAFIIECKATKYREPIKDIEKAFTRVSDDFKKSLQKGYDQTFEVKRVFMSSSVFDITNEKGQKVDQVDTKNYKDVFSIIVTQERFGQIQCDLGLLLEIEKDDVYPWSVYIDDLETFMLTLKRKNNALQELVVFLNNRERLHKRLFCYDELELAALFIMDRVSFIKVCYSDKIFASDPTMNGLFDSLYHIGIGFKNERNIEEKLLRNDPYAIIGKELIKKLKLKRIEPSLL